jgi:hypothetical protein
MLSMPLAYPSALDRFSSYVEGFWSPALLRLTEKQQAKAKAIFQLAFSVLDTEEPFSLRRGLIHV